MTAEFAGSQVIIELVYLIASVLFILSLKWMSSPTTARHGIWAGEIGMLLAICGTLLHRGIVDYRLIAIALVLGSIIGVPLGRVAMTAVPQRTALSHAFGALCVTLVGSAEFYLRSPDISRFMMAESRAACPCMGPPMAAALSTSWMPAPILERSDVNFPSW